jgi:hypothetical protein
MPGTRFSRPCSSRCAGPRPSVMRENRLEERGQPPIDEAQAVRNGNVGEDAEIGNNIMQAHRAQSIGPEQAHQHEGPDDALWPQTCPRWIWCSDATSGSMSAQCSGQAESLPDAKRLPALAYQAAPARGARAGAARSVRQQIIFIHKHGIHKHGALPVATRAW